MPRINSLNTFVLSTIINSGDPEDPNYQGATMVFVQTTAPTGWVKDTSADDYTLRGISGSVSGIVEGSVNFTTAFTSRSLSGSLTYGGTLGATTLTSAQIPLHTHTHPAVSRRFISPATATGPQTLFGLIGSFDPGVVNTHPGTTGSHSHPLVGSTISGTYASLNLAVRYVDVILATRA